MKNEGKVLYLVIPCYNEEEMLPITYKALKEKMGKLIKSKKISKDSKIVLVNDGSKDKTWEIIEDLHKKDSLVSGVNLSRNRGHQNALLAGLMTVKEDCDMAISMDADLQDDINVIDKFVDEFYAGSEIVYGVRSSRKKDSIFKRVTAKCFYKFMKFMGADIIYNHADYRLTSKRVLDHLEDFEEVNLFLRGMFPLIGFKSDIVYYERHERFAGKSKYPLKKMLNFAWDGVTSFSFKPIRMVLNVGITIFVLSLIMLIYCLVVKLLGQTVDGWTFIVGSIWLISGIQMLSIGIIGEYIGKVYSETKRRPRYIVSRNLEEENNIKIK